MSERRGRVNIFKTREENFVSPSDHVILYSASSDNGHSLLTAAFIKPRFSRLPYNWYRPPDSPIGIFSPFETLIGKLDSENIEYFLMGDLTAT